MASVNSSVPTEQNSKKKNTRKVILIISLILIVALIAAIIVIVAVKTPLTADKANKEYITVLDENYDDIVRFEKSAGVNGVAFFDVNRSGIDDMVYVTRDKNGVTRMHIAFDDDSKIVTDSAEVGDVFEVFAGKKSGVIRLFTRDKTPIGDKNIRIESLSDLSVKESKLFLSNKKSRYHNSDTNTVSYEPVEEGGEDFTANESSFSGVDEGGSVILIDPVEPVPGIPLPGDPENSSISVSVDEGMKKLGGEEGESATETPATAEPTEATEPEAPEPTVAAVDPAALDEKLNHFLASLFHYFSDDDTQKHKEFDCENLENCYDSLVYRIASAYSCFNFADYANFGYTGDLTAPDPLGKFRMGHTLWKEDDVVWIMKNIYHIPDEEIRPMIDAALAKNADNFYEYTSGGVTYLCAVFGAKGDSFEYPVIDEARFDGERYYIIYHNHADYGGSLVSDSIPFYAEVSPLKIDGETYWTLYKHSEIIPDLPEISKTTEPAETPASDPSAYLEAYAAILRQKDEEYQYDHRFQLLYIDDDDIPELAYFQGMAHMMGVELYTFYNNEAVYLDRIGAYGTIPYSERNNRIFGYTGINANEELEAKYTYMIKDGALEQAPDYKGYESVSATWYGGLEINEENLNALVSGELLN